MGVWSELTSALKHFWFRDFGVTDGKVPAFSNGVTLSFRNAADTADIEAISFGGNSTDDMRILGTTFRPFYQGLPFPLDVSFATRHIFTNPCPFPIKVIAVYVTFSTAESTATTLTAYVEKLASGKAAGSGTTIMSGTFNMKSTADIPQSATLRTDAESYNSTPYVELAQGERLAWVLSDTPTELAGVTVSVFFDTGGRVEFRNILCQDNTRCIDRHIHVANVPKTTLYMAAAWGVAAAATATVQPRRGQGTETAAAGDVLTAAAIDLEGTANIPVLPALTATAANRILDVDNRYDLDFSGTVTAVRNLVVTLAHSAQKDGFEVDTHALLDADIDNVSRRHFTAHQMIQAIQSRYLHAAQDAGENVDLEIAHSGTAPGGGTGIITNDTGAGFDGDGANETVEVGVMAEVGIATMRQGDSLDMQGSDTDDLLANVVATVNFRAAA